MSELAGRQFGVVTADQLRALGFTGREIRGRLERGLLHPLHRGAFAVGHGRVVRHARLLAAQLTCGPASFLSHRTAAAVWGLREVNTRRIEVTLPGTFAMQREGLVIHRSAAVAPDEVRTRNGLRVSSVPRLLVESARTEKQQELERLITEAIRHRALDFANLERTLTRHDRRPGMATLKQALRDYRPGPDRSSSLELAFDRLIAGPDIPAPRSNVIIAGYECDRYWPEHRLVVELDGRNYHAALQDMERDKRKDARLALLGLTVLRFTELRFALEPEEIRAEVVAMTRPERRQAAT